jgi:hypothetical protein
MSYFKVFRSQAYVSVPKEEQQNKVSMKAEEAIFIGYEKEPKVTSFDLQSIGELLSLQLLHLTSFAFLVVSKRQITNHPQYLFHITAKTTRSPLTCHYWTNQHQKMFQLHTTISSSHRKNNTPIHRSQRTVLRIKTPLEQPVLYLTINLHNLIVHLPSHLKMSKNLDVVLG